MAYWVPRPSVTDKMIELTASGALERGEVVLLCLISDTQWKDDYNSPGWANPEHWVRVRAVEATGDELHVSVFSFGGVQDRTLSKEDWGRIYFEALFGKLNEPS